MLNPYNFVRFQAMAPDARKTPAWHSDPSNQLYSGKLTCVLLAKSPIFIPHHDSKKNIPLPPYTEENDEGEQVHYRPDKTHTYFQEFFHYEQGTPVIPGSSLKGVIRSVAEAAVNGCLSVFSGSYKTTKKLKEESKKKRKDKKKKEIVTYVSEKEIEPYLKKLHILPCTHVIQDNGVTDSGLCPTCRLFGMTGNRDEQEETAVDIGSTPDAFAGKVRFSDAPLEGKANYCEKLLLTELSSPDATSYLYYKDFESRELRGRKFYYHRNDPYCDTEYEQRAYDLIQAHEESNTDILQKPVSDNDGLDRKVTVTPLEEGSQFHFSVQYHNLEEEELELLIYALTLDGQLYEDKQETRTYHKIGYGKPAGLGSARIYITAWTELNLSNRYNVKNGKAWHPVPNENLNKKVLQYRAEFLSKYGEEPQIYDLESILHWRNNG